jgi:uncharacterized membrane protein
METNKGKYDTNPLDPDVEKKSQDSWGDPNATAHFTPADTSEVRGSAQDSARKSVYSEAPTRLIDNPPLDAPYPSVYVPPTYAPPTYAQQTPPVQNTYQGTFPTRPTARPVAGIGIPEKWAMVLPYMPAYIGLIVSLLELFLVPRREVKVRFHASQALALHIGILVIHTIFGVISTLTDSSLGGSLFKAAAFIFLIVSMVRVAHGRPHHIAPLSEPAQWFNEHIEPRNQG